MTETRNDTRPSKGQTQPWILERMLHRAQPHLTERGGSGFAPWVMIAGVIVVMLVAALALFLWTGRVLGVNSGSNTPAVPNALATGTTRPQSSGTSVSSPAAAGTRSQVTPLAAATPTIQVAPSTATPSVVKYKVKPGDTLLEIAIKYGVSFQTIMKANGMKNDVIRIGDELTIPLPTPAPH